MADSTPELRAKDLLRRQEIAVREVVGQQTVGWLVRRKYWRPAGCTARLFEAMNTEDPFLPEPDFIDPGPRPLYVAERFVRIDNADKSGRPRFAAPEKKVPAWMEKLRELREENERRKGEGRPPVKPSAKKKEAPPEPVHTPAFGAAAAPEDPRKAKQASDAGRFRAKPRRPIAAVTVEGDEEEAIDRTPPRIVPGAAQPDPTGPRSRRPGAAADGEAIDRTPPRIVPQKPNAPDRSRTTRTTATAEDDGIDRTPPRVHHVVTDERGEALRAHRERRRRKSHRGELGGQGERPVRRKVVHGGEPPGGRPPHPNQSRESEPETAAPAASAGPPEPYVPQAPPSGAASMGDIFGGPATRVRIGRRKKQEPAAEAEAPATTEAKTVDRRPPIFRGAVPTGDGSAAVPPGAESEPEPASASEPAPPPASAGGLDDLFSSPAPPRRAPSSGGLDDLFGAGPPTRVRIGKRKKQEVAAIEEEPKGEEGGEKETIDRTPPKIADVDPSKLEK